MIVDKGYSYNDITIIPSVFSEIESRSDIVLGRDFIFTAPMTSVVSDSNYKTFINNGVIPIIPRSIPIEKRLQMTCWIAVSLKEFEEYFVNSKLDGSYKVCIDIANGHMHKLIQLAQEAKQNSDITIMIGNIANPKTYLELTKINSENKIIDYVRCGIGGGSGCLTTSNTGIHYPMASLIHECNIYKIVDVSPKLIADGGIRNYSDIIKALALGADYVMIGSLFAQCIESAGEKFYKDNMKPCLDPYYMREIGVKLVVKFYGMASADGQIALSGCKTKTSEGITKYLDVLYSLPGWMSNMKDYLKSAMSYCNAKRLKDFIGKPDLIINSVNSINAVNK